MNRYKHLLFTAFAFFAFLPGAVFFPSSLLAQKELTLIKEGTSAYSIVLAEAASPSEKHGAEELQKFLEEISGCKLPVMQTGEAVSSPSIFVGGSEALAAVLPDFRVSEFGEEEYIMKTAGNNLVLAGGRLRGSMYAVYGFLEDVLGCRWYTQEVTRIPEMTTVTIPALDRRESPSFEYREPFWWEAFDGDWAARNRVNSSRADLTEQHGGKVTYRGVHTFFRHVPPLKWFGDHPEYYSFESGRRVYEGAELCLTNPEMAKIYTHSLRQQIDSDPEGSIFSVSQEDWYGPCVCPHCAELDHEEGDTYAASLIFFVNRVADRIARSHPDKRIGTLPYKYSAKAPKTLKPRDNVIIRFVHTYTPHTCDAHPVTDCELSANFVRDFKDWARLTDKLYLWDYYVDFAHYVMPYPNFTGTKADIKWFDRNGLDGIFCQGAYEQGGGGEFAELRSYLLAKILWDADRDPDRVIDDFLNGVYGDAGWPIRQYIDLLEDKVAREWIHMHHSSPPTIGYLTPEVIAEAERLFNEAESLVQGQPDVLDRVRKARLPLRYAKLVLPVAREVQGNRAVAVSRPDAPRYGNPDELKGFMRDVRRYGIQKLREGEVLDYTENRLVLNNMDSHKLVSVENPLMRVDFLPRMGGRIYRIIHKKSGRNLLHIPTPHEWLSPMGGGYSESVERGGREEDFTCEVSYVPGGQKAVLTGLVYQRGDLRGAKITREIFIPENSMELQIETSCEILDNPRRGNPRRVSGSMVVSLGNLDDISFGFLRDGKEFIEEAPPGIGGYGRRNQSYVAKAVKGNGWAALNKKLGIGIINEFDPASIDGCSVSYTPEINTLSLGIDGPGKVVKQGDVLKLKQKIRVIDNLDELSMK